MGRKHDFWSNLEASRSTGEPVFWQYIYSLFSFSTPSLLFSWCHPIFCHTCILLLSCFFFAQFFITIANSDDTAPSLLSLSLSLSLAHAFPSKPAPLVIENNSFLLVTTKFFRFWKCLPFVTLSLLLIDGRSSQIKNIYLTFFLEECMWWHYNAW